MKLGEYQMLNEALYVWFRQQREKAIPITGLILMEKAKLLFPQLYPEEFQISMLFLKAWLSIQGGNQLSCNLCS